MGEETWKKVKKKIFVIYFTEKYILYLGTHFKQIQKISNHVNYRKTNKLLLIYWQS